MWDTTQTKVVHLSHDMPCTRCGHGAHTFLACGIECACVFVGHGAQVTATDQGSA